MKRDQGLCGDNDRASRQTERLGRSRIAPGCRDINAAGNDGLEVYALLEELVCAEHFRDLDQLVGVVMSVEEAAT